jgi:hypothetical protein
MLEYRMKHAQNNMHDTPGAMSSMYKAQKGGSHGLPRPYQKVVPEKRAAEAGPRKRANSSPSLHKRVLLTGEADPGKRELPDARCSACFGAVVVEKWALFGETVPRGARQPRSASTKCDVQQKKRFECRRL